MEAILQYKIEQCSLTQLLSVTFEIYAISGLTLTNVNWGGVKYNWHINDIRLLRRGLLSENDYMTKHRLE